MNEEVGFDFDTSALLGPLNTIVETLQVMNNHLESTGEQSYKSVLKANIVSQLILGTFKKIKDSFFGLPEVGATFDVVANMFKRNLLEPLRRELVPLLNQVSQWAVDNRETLVRIGVFIADAFRIAYEVISSLVKIGKSLIDGFASGVKSVFGDTTTTIGDIIRLVMTKIAATVIFISTILEPVANTIGMILGTVISWILKTDEALGAIAAGGIVLLARAIWSNVLPAISALIKSVWAFTSALLANPLTWVVVGIAALTAGVIYLIKNFDKVKDWFDRIKPKLIDFKDAVLNFMLAPLRMAAEGFMGPINIIWDLYNSIVEKLQYFGKIIYEKIIDPIVQGFNEIYDKVIGKIKEFFDFFKKKTDTEVKGVIDIQPRGPQLNPSGYTSSGNKSYNFEHRPTYQINAQNANADEVMKLIEKKEKESKESASQEFWRKLQEEKMAEGY